MNQPTVTTEPAATNRIGTIAVQIAGPALVILVVSSISWFLIEVSYAGPLVDRCKWIFSLFCFAAVLISRISIEEGYERAYGYGFLLAIATFVSTSRFMEGNIVGLALILGFVWWSAGRLTWDCTFIDNTRDATGQGMIDLAIDRVTGKSVAATDAPPKPGSVNSTVASASAASGPQIWSNIKRIFLKRRQPNTPGLWAFYFLIGGLPLFGLGQLLMPMNDTLGHRAVAGHFFVYITALLGLLMLSSITGLHRYLAKNNAAVPDWVAWKWVITGSILAVSIAAVTWLLPRPVPGYSLSSLIPHFSTKKLTPSKVSTGQDGQESAKNTNLGGGSESRDKDSGESSVGNQGSNQKTGDSGQTLNKSGSENQGGKSPGPAKGGGQKSEGPHGPEHSGNQTSTQPESSAQQGLKNQESGQPTSGGKKSQDKSGGKQPSEKQQPRTGGQQENKGGQGGKKSDSSTAGKLDSESPSDTTESQKSGDDQSSSKTGEQQSGDEKTADQMSGDAEPGNNPSESKSESENNQGERKGRDSPENRRNSDKNKDESKQSGGSSQRNDRPSRDQNQGSSNEQTESPQTGRWASSLGGLLRFIFWCVALLVVAWYAIKHREKILPWIRSFLAELAEFWNRLFAGKQKPKAAVQADAKTRTSQVLPGFAAFSNPFQTGEANHWTPEQIVIYTFVAFEAWSRDQQCQREPDQTALEFARQTSQKFESLSNDARNLATLYSHLAYARSGISRSAAMTLTTLWDKLATFRIQPVASATSAVTRSIV